MKIKLSYVITTKNKLTYLKEVMPRLLEHVQSDEEIVVTDGASTDGSKEYLENLFQSGKIHQFISERDKCEAHGWNKAFLMARGELVKLITDDDVFYYPAIRECREFMLIHPEIDVLRGNIAVADTGNFNSQQITVVNEYMDAFVNWLNGSQKPFLICGISMMFRKDSLPLLGLFHTQTRMPDLEHSLRIATLANMAFYTKVIAIHLENPASITRAISPQEWKDEYERVTQFYSPPGNINSKNNPPTLRQRIINLATRIMSYFNKMSSDSNSQTIHYPENLTGAHIVNDLAIDVIFKESDIWLDANNRNEGNILYKNS